MSDKCIEAFQDLKLKKKYKFITYKLSDDNATVVQEQAAESGKYEDFVAALPKGECRYAVYDFEYEKAGEGQRNKICFFAWCDFPSLHYS